MKWFHLHIAKKFKFLKRKGVRLKLINNLEVLLPWNSHRKMKEILLKIILNRLSNNYLGMVILMRQVFQLNLNKDKAMISLLQSFQKFHIEWILFLQSLLLRRLTRISQWIPSNLTLDKQKTKSTAMPCCHLKVDWMYHLF